MTKTIAELSEEIHQNAIDKGFWENGLDLPKMLMLTVGELSEAMEADRKDKYSNKISFYREMKKWPESDNDVFIGYFSDFIKDTVEDELADVVIRIFDIAKYMDIDLQWHIEQKMKYNKLRPYKHGKKY